MRTRRRSPLKRALLLLFILCASGGIWYRFALRAVRSGDESVVFSIDKGEGVSDIAARLYGHDLIRSPLAFKIYVSLHGLRQSLYPGAYTLSYRDSLATIVQTLSSPKDVYLNVTIPEGFTVKDIDGLLAEKGLTKSGELLACAQTCSFAEHPFPPIMQGVPAHGSRLEGYLFPDTYEVSVAQFDARVFLERLLSTFDLRVAEGLNDAVTKSGHSLHEIVTMASLIESEAGDDAERAIIAGILWKRFAVGMGLGVDATVRYALDKHTGALTAADLAADTPYNLRKYRGLPPGPISSPGLASIQAALSPQESPYWYYLHGSDGKIRYAATNDEHNENKRRYL